METPTEALAYVMPFGKHKGKPIGWVLNHEPTYITSFLPRIELREPFVGHFRAVLEWHNAGGKAEDPNAQNQEVQGNPVPQAAVLDR
jgi:hypothetical protein